VGGLRKKKLGPTGRKLTMRMEAGAKIMLMPPPLTQLRSAGGGRGGELCLTGKESGRGSLYFSSPARKMIERCFYIGGIKPNNP